MASYDYELPHVSRIWNNAFSRYVLDGWNIAGITTLQTGFPLWFSDTAFPSLSCSAAYVFYNCPDTPNYLGGPLSSLDPRNSALVNTSRIPGNRSVLPNYWFNPNLFGHAAFGTFGNFGRGILHRPGINNTDLTLAKRIRFGEGSPWVELRLESYNLFNHTQFGSPVVDFNAPTFGRVLSAAPGRTVQLGAKVYF